MTTTQETDQLYALNDAISQWATTYGQLERWTADEADDRLNDATHYVFNLLTGRAYRTAAEARDAAIDYSHHANEQDMSYGELLEWQTHWEQTLILFPELADEFRENGIC